MQALRLRSERQLEIVDIDPPPPPAANEVQVRIGAVALNHIDVWGWRGMAFVHRQLPVVVGVEAAGTIIAAGRDVRDVSEGQTVALYGALTCGRCRPCREGRDNFCEAVAGIYGFHIDGFGRALVNMPSRLVIPVPHGLDCIAAACAPVTFGTVEHMLFDNAKLRPGEIILIHAGGSGIGSAAIQTAKAIGANVIATVGADEKIQKARALGADHVINYRKERFESVVRKLTGKTGVDVVFEHVGAETWASSMLSMRKGGRLVTCGSTSGPSAYINLFQLFQQQLRIYGSFGCSLRNVADALDKLADGIVRPVIDTTMTLGDVERALHRLSERQVFGKLMVMLKATGEGQPCLREAQSA